jgi:hypothetical protein
MPSRDKPGQQNAGVQEGSAGQDRQLWCPLPHDITHRLAKQTIFTLGRGQDTTNQKGALRRAVA